MPTFEQNANAKGIHPTGDLLYKRPINFKRQRRIDRIISGGKINIMQPKRYIVWSKKEIDLGDSFQRKWYIKQVLLHGRSEDIARLDWNEVKTLLSDMDLPPDIKNLWGDYFNAF